MDLLAPVAFRLRNIGSLSRRRLLAALLLLVLLPVATRIPAPVTLALLASVLVVLIAYEAIRFAETRARIRHADTLG